MKRILGFLLVMGVAHAEFLQVEVKDAGTGLGVQASVIAVGKIPFMTSTLTDTRGIAFIDVPSFDPLSIAIRASGYCPVCKSGKELQRGHVTGELEPAMRIYGTVEDSFGTPLSGSKVSVQYLDSSSCRVQFDPLPTVQVTNDRGEYLLRDVDARREFEIVARHPQQGERKASKAEVSAGYPAVRSKRLDFVIENNP